MQTIFKEETSMSNRLIPTGVDPAVTMEEIKKSKKTGSSSRKTTPVEKLSSTGAHTSMIAENDSDNSAIAGTKLPQVSRRLVVDQLILENFKSYQGVQTIDGLDDSFVSVIGPNGSGKSNLLEALLFVFGYRANKMRLKKLSELIHSSAGYQCIKKASVSVRFNEIEEIVSGATSLPKQPKSDQSNPTRPTTRVVNSMLVTRIVHTSGDSEYEYDGQKISRADLIEVFRKKGMDLSNNRFIILQGEVEQISLMKSTTGKKDEPGLLEYLEEIIGSGKYVEDITEMSDKHLIVRRQKEDTMVKLHDCKKELDSMETHKDQALEFLELERKIMSLQHVGYTIRKSELEAVVVQQDQVLAEQDKVVAEKSEVLAGHQAELHAEVEKKTQLLDQIKEKENEKSQFQKEMDRYEQSEVELRRNEKRLVDEEAYLKGKIQAGEAEIEEKKISIESIQREFPAMQSYFSQIHIKLEGLSKQKQEISKKIEPKVIRSRQRIESCNEELAKLQSNIDQNEKTQRNLQQEISNLYEKKERLEKDQIRGNAKLSDSAIRCDRLQSAILSANSDKERFEGNLVRLTSEVDELEKECSILNQDLLAASNMLNERRNHTDDRHSKNKILSYLHSHDTLRKRGKIYGRIGDLGSIDKQYDVAISATSTHFDCILVDTNDTAKNCLNELKKDKIGFAKFMALNKIGHLRSMMETPFRAIPGTKRLFDLVKTRDEDVKLAFYKILKDTLVVEDLSAAQNIAFGNPETAHKYRVVTLDGYIIDPNGSMTGGGKPKTGMVGNQIKPMLIEEEPTEKITIRRDNLIERLESQHRILAIKKRDLGTLPSALANVEHHLRRATEDLKAEQENRQEWTDKLKRVHHELNGTDFEAVQAEKKRQISSLQAENEKIVAMMQDFVRIKEEMEVKVGEIGGEEFRKLEKEMNQLRELASKEQAKLDKSEASKQAFQKFISERQTLLSRLSEDLKTLAADREKKSKAVKEVGELFRVWTDKVETLEKEIEDLEDLKGDFEKTLQEKEARVQAASAELEAEQTLSREISDLITQLKDELEDVDQEIKVNTEMYTNFKEAYLSVQELFKIKENGKDGSQDSKSKVVDEPAEEEAGRKKKGKGGKQDKAKSKKVQAEASLSLELVTPDTLIQQADIEAWGLTLAKVENQIASLKLKKRSHIANTDIIMAYREKMVEYQTKFKEFQVQSEAESTLRSDLEEIKSKRRNEFVAGFNFIAKTLKSVYETLTGGGDAELEFVDSHDPFSEGISFSVRPPHKSWKQMSKLSGGEKTLSSLSLIFALHYYKPTPIYIMDEIDAALDFRNVEIVSKFIKERTKDAQFIVISLRNYMYEQANQLLGICKINDTTKTVRLDPFKIETLIGGLPESKVIKKDAKSPDEDEKEKKDSADIDQIKKNMLKSRTTRAAAMVLERSPPKAVLRDDFVDVSEDVAEVPRADKHKHRRPNGQQLASHRPREITTKVSDTSIATKMR